MPTIATFESFQAELGRLVERFQRNLTHLKNPGYDEASLRQEFLNPFFRALGWDVENEAGRIPTQRECEIESRTHIEGRQKRADYLFRTDGRDRFVCEAKKPAEELIASYAFQTKRYAWNKNLFFALLTDFEELKIYIVAGKPHIDSPDVGLWKKYHFLQYPLLARELWDVLAREKVAAGSFEKIIESLPKKTDVRGKAKQLYLVKPDRARSLDNDFLNFLDEARRSLASDLISHNDRETILEGTCLNEATQHILDRLLFLRICEDRDIDTGTRLDSILETWRRNYDKETGLRAKQQPLIVQEEPPSSGAYGRIQAPKDSLYHAVVRHFRALDRRPPSHVPFFNGNLFKKHFSEDLRVSDQWLADFITDLSDEESPYLFNVIPVEILGTIYERFLGKVVRPYGRGVVIEEKPEVRKAGGVYYTPRYIVDYIVEQTVGKLLNEILGRDGTLSSQTKPKVRDGDALFLPPMKELSAKTHALRILDPACGSGSFLIRAFERVCEHWLQWLTDDLNQILDPPSATLDQSKISAAEAAKLHRAWEKKYRHLGWVDDKTGDVHLTVSLKRQILQNNIFGVDLDPGAVEVTQLSLYLKMLENENRNTLARERQLFAEEVALLPPLQENIKCGNSLIASDFSLVPDDLVRVRAFDWNVQFPNIFKRKHGGFDAVIGNPPYIRIQGYPSDQTKYFSAQYQAATGNYDIYVNFAERGLSLLSKTGRLGMILPNKFLRTDYGLGLRRLLAGSRALSRIVDFEASQVFEATTYTCLLFLKREESSSFEVGKSKADEKQLSSIPFQPCSFENLNKNAWTFADETQSALMQKLRKKGKRLLDLPADMSRGSSSGDDEIFMVEQRGHSLEPGILRTPIFASDFGRYFFNPSGKWKIIFPYVKEAGKYRLMTGAELKQNFPNTFAYLQSHAEKLKQRKQYSEWFGYSAPRNLELHERAQIIVPLLAESGVFALIPEGKRRALCPMASGGFSITLGDQCTLQPGFVLGLLNSRLMFWFLRNVSNIFRGGWITCTKQYFGELPIINLNLKKPTDKARHDKVVALVDKMLVLVPKLRVTKNESERQTLQNAVTATDQQIDKLVYELYGLTDKEIDLVEKSRPTPSRSISSTPRRTSPVAEMQLSL